MQNILNLIVMFVLMGFLLQSTSSTELSGKSLFSVFYLNLSLRPWFIHSLIYILLYLPIFTYVVVPQNFEAHYRI